MLQEMNWYESDYRRVEGVQKEVVEGKERKCYRIVRSILFWISALIRTCHSRCGVIMAEYVL